MALTIRVLLENHKGAGADKSLRARPGLSLLVQDESTSILFDTGPDGSFMQNALAMGIDLSDVSAVVLSHGHYDHCGGVPWLPDNSRIICHPDIARERYAAMTFLGITRRIKNCRVRWTIHATEWCTRVTLCRLAKTLSGQGKYRWSRLKPTALLAATMRSRTQFWTRAY